MNQDRTIMINFLFLDYLHQAHSHQFLWFLNESWNQRIFTWQGISACIHSKVPHGTEAVPSATKDHALHVSRSVYFSPCPAFTYGTADTESTEGQAKKAVAADTCTYALATTLILPSVSLIIPSPHTNLASNCTRLSLPCSSYQSHYPTSYGKTLSIGSSSEIKMNSASIFRQPKIHCYPLKSLYLSPCESEWKQTRWERTELWEEMFISEGPNYRSAGKRHHREKMLPSVSERSLGALVTSWLGRSENSIPVPGLQEIFHYISEGTFMSWITASRWYNELDW